MTIIPDTIRPEYSSMEAENRDSDEGNDEHDHENTEDDEEETENKIKNDYYQSIL